MSSFTEKKLEQEVKAHAPEKEYKTTLLGKKLKTGQIKKLSQAVLEFSEYLCDTKLYPYQREFSLRIIRSLLQEDVAEITALFSRQCIPAGRLIAMADGSLQPVEEVSSDDQIFSFNPKKRIIEPDVVEDIWAVGFKDRLSLKTVNGQETEASPDHLFYAEDGWKELGKFKVGEKILLRENFSAEWDRIQSLTPLPAAKMYDLQVRKNENFISDGFIVHNSGKTETVAVTIAGCIIMLPILAKYIQDRRIAKYKKGCWIGIFAPAHEQADTMSQRLLDKLRSDHAKKVLADDEINIEIDDRYTRSLSLPNGSIVRTHSAAKQAKIESKTYHCLCLDESQSIDPIVYSKSIFPMATATAGTQVKIGTPNYTKSDFYDACQRNARTDAQNPKDKRHFQSDYEVASKYNPAYKKAIKAAMEQQGFDSDSFRMSYRLHWLLERGMLVDATLFESLGGNYWITPYDHKNDVVVGIDIGKITASTVVTVVQPDYEKGIQMAPDDYRARKRIYNWLELSGDKYDEQTFQITQFLANYKNIKRIHIDATGVGQHMFDNLTTYYQQEIDRQEMEVIGFIASPTSNSEGYTRLLLDIQNLRLEFPNSEKAKKSETQRRFVAQMTNVRKNFRGALLSVQESEELPMKDYVSSLMLACWGCDISGEMPELDADDRNILFGGTIFGRGHKNELFSGPRERNPLIH